MCSGGTERDKWQKWVNCVIATLKTSQDPRENYHETLQF